MNESLLKVAHGRLCGGVSDYVSKFDPKPYLATYYSDKALARNETDSELLSFQLETLHYIVQQISSDKENDFISNRGQLNQRSISQQSIGCQKSIGQQQRSSSQQSIDGHHNQNNNNRQQRSNGHYNGSHSSQMDIGHHFRLLDVGSGPSIHSVLSASQIFQDIILSDLSKSNREELIKFLEYDADSFDWSPVAKLAGDLEQVDDEVVLERVREKVKGVIECNILETDIIHQSYGQFDAISCFFCLESACDTMKQFESATRNILKRLKRRGSFILGGVLNNSYYDAGGGRMFRNLPLTKRQVVDALETNRVEVDQWFEFQTPFPNDTNRPRTTHNAVHYVCYGVKRK